MLFYNELALIIRNSLLAFWLSSAAVDKIEDKLLYTKVIDTLIYTELVYMLDKKKVIYNIW